LAFPKTRSIVAQGRHGKAVGSFWDRMKTGRLLKFHRPGGQIQAYFYRDAGRYRAAVYSMAPGSRAADDPVHSVSSASEAEVERRVRAWVDAHFPRQP
jgi:hypothetical protein